MNAKFSDFIGMFPNGMSNDLCDLLISRFEEMHKLGLTGEGQTGLGVDYSLKKSFDVDFLVVNQSYLTPIRKRAVEEVDACYQIYLQKYSQYHYNVDPHKIVALQVQKYPANEKSGYFSFHCEAGVRMASDRVMTYMVYLNDVAEGGETEFLEQCIRIKPKKGTVVFFPTHATHVHRGNPVLSGEDKYILTGWYNFV